MTYIFAALLTITGFSYSFAQNLNRAAEFGKNPLVRILIQTTGQSVSVRVPANTVLKNHWLNKRFKADTVFTVIPKKDFFLVDFKGFSLKIQDSLCLVTDTSSISTIGGKQYRGSFNLYKTDGGIEIVNVLDIEFYLFSVIPAEIGNGRKKDDFQAVMAQSVAARTFTIDKIINNRSKSVRYDLLATTFDQVYDGVSSENKNYESILKETRGVVAIYNNELIQSLYHSTCGGQTENSESIWGGNSFGYLRSVYCGDDSNNFCSISPYFRWERSFSVPGNEQRLRNNLTTRVKGDSLDTFFKAGSIRDFSISKRDSSGRVSELWILNGKKNISIKGDYVRWLFADEKGAILPSNWFSIKSDYLSNHHVRSVEFKGRGYGHGLGMCQWGAIGMSRLGYDYAKILKFYYRGIDLVRVY